jgi:hypothetical protein
VIVIDSDQGQSGKFSADREGFLYLLTEVSLDTPTHDVHYAA